MFRIFTRGIKSNCNYMPKKKGKLTDGTDGVKTGLKTSEKSSISTNKEGCILISLQVKPGSKINAITGVSEDAVSVQISSPPVDGEANKEIIRYFSELLKISKSNVDLKGGKSRQKVLSIRGENLTTSQVMEILVEECGK